MPFQAATAAASTGLAYSTTRKIEQLCDGSYLSLVQTSGTTLKLVQITSPGGTPTFTTLSQTFVKSGATNLIGDIFILNNGSTSSDVWVAYSPNDSSTGLLVAHGTYTASGGTWSWDNTGTTVSITGLTGGFMVPSIVWNGTNLIVAVRGNSTNYNVYINYTGTKNGTSGWQSTPYNMETTSGSSHFYPILLHDPVVGCTILVYSVNGDTVYARVIADSTTPSSSTSWSARVALSSTVGVGAANIAATLDTANARLHVVYGNSSVATNPYYNSATYTTTSITPGTSFSVDTGSATFSGPAIGLDAASPPNVFIAWSSAAAGSAADVMYNELQSPYGSGNLLGATNLTSNTTTDNAYPHMPTLAPFTNGYVPLLYAHAVSPWAVEYDNSIAATQSGVHLAGKSVGVGTASATVDTGVAYSGNSVGVGTASATLKVSHPLTGSAVGQAVATAALSTGTHGTGIGDIAVTTSTVSWANSTNGAGSGTETRVAYDDGHGYGWAVGIMPTYGGDLVSSKYERNGGVDTQEASLSTTTSGGDVHILEQTPTPGGFSGSEYQPFTLTELAPTGTKFRRYYRGDWGPDTNGITWAVYACIYPGDPGIIAYRFDMINSGSAITLNGSDGLEVALIGSLQQTDSTWSPTNGFYGQVGGTPTTGWPVSLTNADPDYVGITPAVASGMSVGQLTVRQKRSASLTPVWNTPQVEYLQNSSRLKFKLQATVSSFPAATTSTLYFLRVLRRGLTTTDANAISADYLNPGTPSPTAGTFTSFSYDEAAYIFSATNHLATSLDMSPSGVTVRYKPRLRVDGWVGGTPKLVYNGATLTNGVDYRHYLDTATSKLYIQLYFDVVTSGATTGQRNNATLDVSPAWSLQSVGTSTASATVAVRRQVSGTAVGASTAQATIQVQNKLAGASAGSSTASAAVQVQNKLAGTSVGASTATSGLQVHRQLAGTSAGAGTAHASITSGGGWSGVSHGASTAQANVQVGHRLAGSAVGASTATAGLSTSNAMAGASHGASTASATVRVGHALAGKATGSSTATASLPVSHRLAGSAVGRGTATLTLHVGGMDGTAVGASTAHATLTVQNAFSGVSHGTSATSGALSTSKAFAGSAHGASTAQANVLPHPTLSGIAAGVAIGLAALVMAHRLAGTAVGTGSATAFMRSGVVPGGVGVTDTLIGGVTLLDTTVVT